MEEESVVTVVVVGEVEGVVEEVEEVVGVGVTTVEEEEVVGHQNFLVECPAVLGAAVEG